MSNSEAAARSIRVLGVHVDMLQIPEVVSQMERWIGEHGRCRCVVVTGMHGVMEARRDPDFKALVNSADLFVPDGMSLIWTARRRGFQLKKRVSGSDLMWEFFKLAEKKGLKSFFYGDTENTLQQLTLKLRDHFPQLQVVGTHSPPFRPPTIEEDRREIETINQSGADIVWVGLGLPKQERWMFTHRDELKAPVVVGVGAAFKFLSGQVKRAPNWMGDRGLEWFWRFLHEPRRLWRRVLIDGPSFTFQVMLELTGLKKYT